MELKHTSKPWELSPATNGEGFNVYGGFEKDRSGGVCYLIAKELSEANARLIAAAPDLLEACEEAEYVLNAAAELYAADKGQRSTVLDGRLQIVRQAIAKTRGEA